MIAQYAVLRDLIQAILYNTQYFEIRYFANVDDAHYLVDTAQYPVYLDSILDILHNPQYLVYTDQYSVLRDSILAIVDNSQYLVNTAQYSVY